MQTDLDALPLEPCAPPPCPPEECSPCEIQEEYNLHKRFTVVEKRLDELEVSGGQVIGIGDVNGLQQALDNKQPSGSYAPAVHNHANATTSNAGFMSATDKGKLNNIQSGATLNQTDAYLTNRANHTGTQAANTISDFAPSVRGTILTGLIAAVSRVLPVNTDSFITAWGKVLKYLTDLKPIAFSGDKADIGLGNVDNTSDINKPVSTAVQNALSGKANSSHSHVAANITDFSTAVDGRITAQKGVSNGLATLGANGLLDSAQWPAGIDDVVEYATLSAFPVTGVQGKIYIAINGGDSLSNPTKQYRWSGSTYVLIPAAPGSSDSVPEGTTNLYFTESRVRATPLTGFATAASRLRILFSDSILQALQKIDKYLGDFGGGAFLNVGTASGTLMAGDDSRVTGAMQKASNLSDLANAGTARTNLGLGSLAVKSSVDLSSADATGIMAAARMPAMSGDVTSPAGTTALTIAGNAVTNAKMANMATMTFKANITGAAAAPQDINLTQMQTTLGYAKSQELDYPTASGTITIDLANFQETWITLVFAGNVVFNFINAAKNRRVHIIAVQGATSYSATFTQTVNMGAAISWNTVAGKVNSIAFTFLSPSVAYGNSTKYA